MKLAEVYRALERRDGQALVSTLKTYALRFRPTAHLELASALRRQMQRRAEPENREAILRRFPVSGDRMPLTGVNPVRQIVTHDAATFDYPPLWSVFKGPRELKSKNPVSRELADCIEKSKLNVKLNDSEERALAVGGCPWRVDWDNKRQCWRFRLFWADTVDVIPHHRHPGDWSRILGLCAQVVGTDGDTAFEVHLREARDPEGDEFTPWRSFRVQGKAVTPFDQKVFPWVCHRLEDDETPLGSPDADLLVGGKSLVASWANAVFTIDHQIAPESNHFSDSSKSKRTSAGPGMRSGPFPTTDRIDVLDYNLDVNGLLEALARQEKALAASRHQSPDAYSARKSADYSAGINLKLRNEPQDLARAKMAAFSECFLVDELIPKMVEVHDAYSRGPDLGPYEVRATLRGAPDFESLASKVQRAEAALKSGAIDLAEYRVITELSRTRKEAAEAIKAIEDAEPATPPQPPPVAPEEQPDGDGEPDEPPEPA